MREKAFSLMFLNEAVTGLVRRAAASDFLRKVAETFATRIILIGLGVVTSVLVARMLGPEGRGLFAVATALGALGVQFGNLGLHASNTYSVAKDRSVLPHAVGNTLVVSLGLGSIGSLMAWEVFQYWPALAPVKGAILALALFLVPLGLAYLLLQNILIGIQEIRVYNAIELYNKILTVLFILAVAFWGVITVESVLSAGLVALLLSVVWMYRKIRPHVKVAPIPSFNLFKKNFLYGFKAYLAAFFAFLVLRCSLLMIQYMLGAEQAGYFSIATTMFDLVVMLPVVVGMIMFPKLSAMSNGADRYRLMFKTSKLVAVCMVIIALLSALLAKPLVLLLYGASFLPAIPAYLAFLPGVILYSINTILMNYLASQNMPIVTIYSTACAALINFLLNLVLVPKLGIVGSAFASSVCYFAMFLMSIEYIYRKRKELTV